MANIGTGAAFHVEVDGVDRTGPIAVPDTGGWQTWQTITTAGIPLTAGARVIRVVFDAAGTGGGVGNFNWFRLVRSHILPTPTTPFGGTPVSLPGIVQAENFDIGARASRTTTRAPEIPAVSIAQLTSTSDRPAIPSGGYYLGWTRDGEWLKYTVNVTQTRNYTLESAWRTSARAPHSESKWTASTGRGRSRCPTRVGGTPGRRSQRWHPAQAGPRVMRVVFDRVSTGGGVGNYNWFRVVGSTPSTP